MKLHPKVEAFKKFVQQHPKLIDHVRNGKEDWQTYYEKWTLYGEGDEYWDQFKEDKEEQVEEEEQKGNQELLKKITKYIQDLDMDELQKQLSQLNGTISNVQTIIEQFQSHKNNHPFQQHPRPEKKNPFFFGKD
ncbi:YlbD family protein [Salirhabdus salicampi]|uniref:YlbD family protein n=1 Tax=Salirhabdus salicampi TaxID=476102 RepID=UPI0020C584BA|nr:YlbD family protein [Salirhabdus salicampi]MCP8616633.1 YlbD family protein [Salirhabdus salicampi]